MTRKTTSKYLKLGARKYPVEFVGDILDISGYLVYCIVFPNGYEYIGRTCDMGERAVEHIKAMWKRSGFVKVAKQIEYNRTFKVYGLKKCSCYEESVYCEREFIHQRAKTIVEAKTGRKLKEGESLRACLSVVNEVLLNENCV